MMSLTGKQSRQRLKREKSSKKIKIVTRLLLLKESSPDMAEESPMMKGLFVASKTATLKQLAQILSATLFLVTGRYIILNKMSLIRSSELINFWLYNCSRLCYSHWNSRRKCYRCALTSEDSPKTSPEDASSSPPPELSEIIKVPTGLNRDMVSSKSTLQFSPARIAAKRDLMHAGYILNIVFPLFVDIKIIAFTNSGVYVPVDEPEAGRSSFFAHNETDVCVHEENNSVVEEVSLLCFAASAATDQSSKEVINQ